MVRLKGIIDIHGEQGVGKTLMALGIAPPEKIAYLFDDVKRPPIDDDEIKKLGHFRDLVQLWKGKKLLQIRDVVLKEIDQIPDKCKVIIFDTWGKRIGPSFQNWGKIHYRDFRETNTLSVGDYLFGQMWSEAYLYESSIISDLSNRFETIVLVSHLKDNYEANVKTGRKEPMVGRDIPRVANFRVWLKRNPDSAVPIALVHKPISVSKFANGSLKTVNLLPRRLCPKENEGSVWDVIERYRQKPFGNRQPLPEEEPTDFEASILSGILTEEQKEIWHANLRAQQIEIASMEDSARLRAKELQKEGKNIMEISETLNQEFGGYDDIGKVGGLLL